MCYLKIKLGIYKSFIALENVKMATCHKVYTLCIMQSGGGGGCTDDIIYEIVGI